MILKLFFLIPLFVIGTICSWTDIKYGKIKNKWVGLGFVWVLVLYLSLFVYNYFFIHQPENVGYLKDMVINGIISLGLGYILWNLKFMAAGDAKLFALYSFLIPPEFYAKSYYLYFPSFVLLVNIFIPIFLFLTVKAIGFAASRIFVWLKEVKPERFFERVNILKFWQLTFKLLKMYIFFSLVFIVLQVVMNRSGGLLGGLSPGGNSTYLFLFLFFAYRLFFRLVSKNKFISFGVVLAGIGCSAYLLLSGQSAVLLNTVKLSIIFMTAIGVISRLLDYYIEHREVRKVDVQDLKEGMFLSAKGLDEELRKKIGGSGKSELNLEQVELIRDFLKDKPAKELNIYKTFAMAPFVFLGALITVLTSSSIIALGISAFQSLF